MPDIQRKIKIQFLNNDNTTKEIRKCYITNDLKEIFDNLHAKVVKLFPELFDENFTISWIDSFGDTIRITNDEELDIAYTESNLKFQVKIIPKNKRNQASSEKAKVKHGAVCDGCEVVITGFRYKCIQCDDFDLCEECEYAGAHPHHFMIRMPCRLEHVHISSIIHHMNNLIKKNSTRSSKKHSSDRHAPKGCHSIPIRLGFPGSQNFNDAILDIILADLEPSKNQETKDKENQETKVKENQETKEEPKVDTCADQTASRKFPGEGSNLLDAKDNNGAVLDTSLTSQDNSGAKTASDEWTILDKDETPETNPAASALYNTTETNIPLLSPTAPSLPANQSMGPPFYPSLPSVRNVTHHPDPVINKGVDALIEMGFSNHKKLLTYLLIAENGDINKVIELLLLPESTKYLDQN